MKHSSLVALAFILFACKSKEPADLLVHNAVIYTVDTGFRVMQAMAVTNGKIVATGPEKELMARFSAKEALDAKGGTIVPGFNDAHAHFLGYAASLRTVDLTGARSWDEALARVRDFAAKNPKGWIIGRGWDQNDWPVKVYPDKSALDRMFPDRPVYLERVDGHAVLVNQAAIKLAGITPASTDGGGSVEVKNGAMTGILIDNAISGVSKLIPEADTATVIASILAAERNCLAAGITSITDCGLSLPEMRLLEKLITTHRLSLKLNVMLSDSEENIDWILKYGPYEKGNLLVRSVKFYGDGALGSRGACLKHDYADKPGWKGFLRKDSAYFAAMAGLLAGSDIQMCTHAIGDSANKVILQVYANVLKGRNDKRWRIEHAQVVDSIDRRYFGDYSIIPSVQPTHATSDMYWAEARLGATRVKTAYALKDLLNQVTWMPLGTDFPVEKIDPLRTFYAAVARKDTAGYPAGGFQMENALSRQEALRGMTLWAAQGSFEEGTKGSLTPGKVADFVILSQDIMKAKEDQILTTRILATFINGKPRYKAPQ
ncbi:amidohydrolase [Chitinophaga rhizosphaerae]|uniref:amidohydrolase n=1 Tax=Chitinophaga rhizosphaerae TaxID=1864947 RepID=UPI000F811AFE|nr:amidohydrolase [Chitinophaga rhizosphaerae]